MERFDIDIPASSNLEDLLTDDLKDKSNRVFARKVYDLEFSYDHTERTALRNRITSTGDAKNIYEFYELMRQAVRNMELRAGRRIQDAIRLTEEDPDFAAINETITISLMSRLPGVWGSGPPGQTGNNVPRVYKDRELANEQDKENPGYKQRVSGLFYDNIVRFTCWAKNNKTANDRVLWFERLLLEYDWWFKLQGVERVIWQGQGADITQEVNEQKWYGRPIDVFVRIQSIRVFREKTIHDIAIDFDVVNSL